MTDDLIRPKWLTPHSLPRDSRRVRRASGGDPCQIHVQLEPINPAGEAVPKSGKEHLTLKEYTQLFGLIAEELSSVVDFFTGKGLQLVEACATSHVVILTGSIQQIETSLGIELWIFETYGQEHLATTDTPALPVVIADQVAGIHGLDQRPMRPPAPQEPLVASERRATVDDAVGSDAMASVSTRSTESPIAREKDPQPPFLPIEVAKFYDFPEHSGKGQRISVLEFGGGYDRKLLAAYFRKVFGSDFKKVFGSDKDPAFKDVSVLNQKNDAKTYGSVEVMLDLQILRALVPKAEFTVYFAPNTMHGWPEALRQAIYSKPTPHVISVSWGAVEANWSGDAIKAIEKHLKAAKGLGITVCVSTGDQGVEPDGDVVQVQYPASSRFALSCGGTTLSVDHWRITTEVVWQGYSEATGGGISTLFKEVPEWQLAAKPGPNLSTGEAGRGIPDVSGVASPLTGYDTLLNNGNWQPKDGTSAVAPLWAALVARMNGILGSRLGFVNPRLYEFSSAFRAIVSGTNGINGVRGYTAGPEPRWNACTGLGSPNGKALMEKLAQKLR